MTDAMVILTVENFISEIRSMSNAEREEIKTEELIPLILQLPDKSTKSDKIDSLTSKVKELSSYLRIIDIRSARNMALIMNLEGKNSELQSTNKQLQGENNGLKKQVDDLQVQIKDIGKTFDTIEQYLRMNNIEEEVIMEILNSLSRTINASPNAVNIKQLLAAATMEVDTYTVDDDQNEVDTRLGNRILGTNY